MDTPPLLRLHNVSFSYPGPGKQVLENIDLSLDYGQRLGLIGPNGCGKTTLFHVIMGLLKPSAGRILFKGRSMVAEDDYRTLRREINLLFQDADDQLFCPTVLEDVAFGPLNLGCTREQARDRARETLSALGLDHLEHRVTHHLSGGEKKLVSLATVLSMQPLALFLDEPTNNLDPVTRTRLIDIIRKLDLAFMIISHDYDFLAETCNDLNMMDHGRVVPGTTAQLHAHHHIHPHGAHPHRHGDG